LIQYACSPGTPFTPAVSVGQRTGSPGAGEPSWRGPRRRQPRRRGAARAGLRSPRATPDCMRGPPALRPARPGPQTALLAQPVHHMPLVKQYGPKGEGPGKVKQGTRSSKLPGNGNGRSDWCGHSITSAQPKLPVSSGRHRRTYAADTHGMDKAAMGYRSLVRHRVSLPGYRYTGISSIGSCVRQPGRRQPGRWSVSLHAHRSRRLATGVHAVSGGRLRNSGPIPTR
jgi:hypothetical protein